MSWTNEIVLEFIELYRREQLLWDPKHSLHRNRSEVTNAWLRIQSSLSISCSVIDLKKKKESLMTSFRMHLNRKKKCQESFHTTWFAYPLMESFLGGKYECDSTNQMENEFFNNVSTFTHTAISDNSNRNLNMTERTNCMAKQAKSHSQANAGKIYVKKFDEAGESKSNTDSKDMDECDLYGQLLAKKLRKLDEHQRDMVMHEIDNIMFRAKMQSGPVQARSYSSSPPPGQRKVPSPIFIVAQQTHSQYEDENTGYQDHMPSQASSQ